MSALGNPKLSPVEAPAKRGAPEIPAPPSRGAAWKWILVLVAIGGGALTAWQLWLKPKQPDPAAAALASVRTTKVVVGPIEKKLRLSGQTTSKEFFNITAPISRGRESGSEMILLYLIPSGTRVKKGALLAQIDAKAQEDHIDDVKDEIERAEADIRKRKAEHAIDTENLNQTILIAKADFEKAALDAKPAETRTVIDQELLKLTVEEAAARYKDAQSQVRYKLIGQKAELRILEITKLRQVSHHDKHVVDLVKSTIKAPMDGLAVVQATYRGGDWNLIQQGDQLMPGQLFMKVVNPENMQVEGFLNQSESDIVRIGMTARISFDAFGGMSFPGKLYSIGAMAAGGMRSGNFIRSIPMKVTIQGSDPKLIPDLSAAVDLLVERQDNVKKIPLAAVHKDGQQDVVFVKRNGRFEKHAVTLGLTTATHAAVTAGLDGGEEIALSRPAGV
ncbi:MAG: HlyD family efflux transporter periplasmic adaptor subunit [Acidobacteriia bacterium]|nr:HlyD family efflux transporter periplasmic adaptor subunit [Terriglobia bacterium]